MWLKLQWQQFSHSELTPTSNLSRLRIQNIAVSGVCDTAVCLYCVLIYGRKYETQTTNPATNVSFMYAQPSITLSDHTFLSGIKAPGFIVLAIRMVSLLSEDTAK